MSTDKRPELPTELWLHIAEMLEPKERHKLIGLNRLFFETAMNERYRNLSLVSPDGANLVETMERLLNPDVAKRVRTLTIWPEEVCRAIYPERDEPPAFKRVPIPKKPDTIWRRVKRRVSKKDTSPEPEYTVIQLPDLPRPPARRRMLKQALKGLTNLEELYIKRRVRLNHAWQPMPPPEQMIMFLPTCMQEYIWPVVRKSIRKLTLDVDSLFFEDIIPGQDMFPRNVRHFVLRLWSSARENFKVSDEVVPFVRQLSEKNRNLEKLSLEGDCQVIWSALGTIPNLRDLELHIPAQLIVQGPTQDTDLHQLLSRNADTIQHLSIIPVNTPRRWISSDSFDPSAEPQWSQVGATSQATLPNLKSLKFKFPWRGQESETLEWRAALDYFVHLGKSATSLTIQDSLSATGLEMLRPDVVEIIVKICPNLVKLNIVYGTLCPDDESVSWTLNPALIEAVSAKFIQQVKDRGCHPCPSLTDISLMTYAFGKGLKYHLPLMKTYAGVLPSIVSFAGIRNPTEDALGQLEPKMAFLAAGSGRNSAWS
ncbi:hypothetical protein H1R20_g3323, partial [Candolleomyces eurysporus]